MLAELHSHSHYSKGTKIVHEGLNSPLQLVRQAKKIGMDALAITDHDSFKSYKEAKKYGKKYGIVIIPGEEISTGEGHMNALGIQEEIKPYMGLMNTIDEIHKQSGIAIAVHPFDIKNEGTGTKCKYADVIESFNGLSLERITNLKNTRFADHEKKPMINGSDAHTIEMVGWAITEIDANDMDSILREIKKGRAKLKNEYIPTKIVTDWTIERMKLSYVQLLDHINKNYGLPKAALYRNMLKLVNKSPGNIDYLFRIVAYCGLGNAIIYGACKEIIGW